MAITNLEGLKKRFPSCIVELDDIARLRAYIDGIDCSPFFEPVSFIQITKGEKRSLLSLDAETLASWANHVSQSSRVKMCSLENGALNEVFNTRFLNAMVL